MTLERAIVDRLVALGFGNVNPAGSGWMLIEGGLSDRPPLVDRPQVAVNTGGGQPRLVLHAGESGTRYQRIVSLVRGETNSYPDARDKVDEFCDLMHSRVLDLGQRQALVRVEIEPLWLGYTEEARQPLWSVNLMSSIL